MGKRRLSAWALAFGLGAAPFTAIAADLAETPAEPLPDAFYISPSAGVMIFDFSDIDANILGADVQGGSLDISPDFDRVAPVLGLAFGARLGETDGGMVLRLRGSGFYSWYDDDDTVEPDPGALVWRGLSDAPGAAVSATAQFNPPAAAGGAGGSFAAFAFATASPAAAGEAGTLNPEGSGAFAAAGVFDVFGISIDYEEELAYWGGELTLAFDTGPSENGHLFTPFFGPVIRGIGRDLETTLSDTQSQSSFALSESLDARYYGAVIGIDVAMPLENGMVLDLSASGAPLYLDADYDGEETNTFGGAGTFSGPDVGDSDSRLAGLFRAKAGLSFPIFGHSWLRVGGEIEYLTDAPTIDRDIGSATASADSTGASAAGSASGQGDLAKLAFDDLFAYGLNATLMVPFGN